MREHLKHLCLWGLHGDWTRTHFPTPRRQSSGVELVRWPAFQCKYQGHSIIVTPVSGVHEWWTEISTEGWPSEQYQLPSVLLGGSKWLPCLKHFQVGTYKCNLGQALFTSRHCDTAKNQRGLRRRSDWVFTFVICYNSFYQEIELPFYSLTNPPVLPYHKQGEERKPDVL